MISLSLRIGLSRVTLQRHPQPVHVTDVDDARLLDTIERVEALNVADKILASGLGSSGAGYSVAFTCGSIRLRGETVGAK